VGKSLICVNMDKLKVDWATHEAARYAVENWHYSKVMPMGKLVKVGAWERERFIGTVIFGRGATPNLGKPYGLKQHECVELVRIAFRHHETPITRIVRIALKFLKQENPSVKLVVSFADPDQGHHGGIYQGGNWIYTGSGADAWFYIINGKKTHPRSIGAKGIEQSLKGAQKIDPNAVRVKMPGKHRYLMPLDNETRRKVEHLSKPFPKRAKQATGRHHLSSGGAAPTCTLHQTIGA